VPAHRFVSCFAFAILAASSCDGGAADGAASRASAIIADGAASRANVIVDDFGDSLVIQAPPQRIVSLNPATTELVFALGAGARLVGRSEWDRFPDSAQFVPDLGAGMQPNVEVVLAARPDLVLLYASGENRPARDAFRRAGIATLTQRVDLIAQFVTAVEQLGLVLGDTVRAAIVRDSVLASLARARRLSAGNRRVTVVWPLWSSPLMVAGSGSFLTELLDAAGATNVFGDLSAPSPQVAFEEVVRRAPDAILSGPVQARELRTDPRWRSLRAVRQGRVLVYDTLVVGRPGVRLGEAALHLLSLLHPTTDVSR
jgi:ABC-type Fe3+-hydroxamate transport system substrate-binding protein